MRFLNKLHEERFIELLNRDNTHPKDSERLALLYVLSGNDDVFKKARYAYDFRNHQIESDCLNSGEVDFCSSSKALIRLGFNLYNGFNDGYSTPIDLFNCLDVSNYTLEVNSCNIRFGITATNEMEVEEGEEIEL
jgi:hypothetical protein